MLRVSVIGLGNAGGQIADLAASNEGINALAINASANDLATIKNIPTILVGDQRGAGKDRGKAKEFIRKSAKSLLGKEELTGMLSNTDILVVVSSTGGGTGSGMNPVLSDVLSKVYPDIKVITIGILPKLSESIASQQNTIEFLKEINMNESLTYSLYDNEKVEGSLNVVMKTVNQNIVNDIITLTGIHQSETELSSIDEQDALKILRTPGRLAMAHVSGFREKDVDKLTIEDQLVAELKSNSQTELELDGIVKRMGLIAKMNERLFGNFDPNILTFKKAFGEPLESFEHTVIDNDDTSLVYVLLSGLSMPDDRIEKIAQRIDEAMTALTKKKESSILDDTNTDLLSELRSENKSGDTAEVVLDDIFGNYMK